MGQKEVGGRKSVCLAGKKSILPKMESFRVKNSGDNMVRYFIISS